MIIRIDDAARRQNSDLTRAPVGARSTVRENTGRENTGRESIARERALRFSAVLVVTAHALVAHVVTGCAGGGLDGFFGEEEIDAGEEEERDSGPPIIRERDTTPPTVVHVAPVDPCLDGDVSFVFTVSDDGAGVGIVRAEFAGTELVVTDDGVGTFTANTNVDTLAQSLHTLIVTAIDTDNNLVDVERTFAVSRGQYVEAAEFSCGAIPDGGAPDTTAPIINIVQPTAGSVEGALVSVSVSVVDDSAVSVVVSGGDAPVTLVGGATKTGVVSLLSQPEGPLTLTAVATDTAQNEASAQRDIVVDHTTPTLAIIEPLAGETRVALTDVVVETADENGVARVALYRFGVAEPLAISVSPAPGTTDRYGLFYKLPCAGLPTSVTFVVESTDVADNVSSANVTVTVTPEGCEP